MNILTEKNEQSKLVPPYGYATDERFIYARYKQEGEKNDDYQR
ncbi:hypothetical protein ACFLXQ_07195 [Chloroflexota bacterium]